MTEGPDVLELRLRHVRFQSSLEIVHVDSLKDLDFNFICLVVEPYPSEKYELVSWGYDIPNIWQVIKFMFQTTNQLWFPVALVPLPHGRKISSPLGIRSTACSSNLALFRNGGHGSGLGRREVEKANSQSCDFGFATDCAFFEELPENRSVAVKLQARYSQRSQVSKKVERHLSITSTHVLPLIFATVKLWNFGPRTTRKWI